MAFITVLGTAILPHMSNLYSKNLEIQEKAIAFIRKSEHLAMGLSTVICFGIMAVTEEFVPIFYGNGYEKCSTLFYFLLPSCIFLAFTNLIINAVLIPKYQSIGAAVGTLFAELTVCVCQILFVKKYSSCAAGIRMRRLCYYFCFDAFGFRFRDLKNFPLPNPPNSYKL